MHHLCVCCQGNINFDAGADQEHAVVSNRQDLVDLARLLSVDTEALEKTLVSRVIAAGGHVVEKQLNVNDSLYARDAFAKVSVLRSSLAWSSDWMCLKWTSSEVGLKT